ncbi:MAG: trypsin-like peptidase domain-containing protein, partial [Fimbriimonadaceae bacterium]|nr:trypsin-like peptidase domain-containing protein [Chitinophagales bacterium]
MIDLKKINNYLQGDSYDKIQQQVNKGKVGKPIPNEHQKKLRELHIEESGSIPDTVIGKERILLDNDLLGINYLSRGLRAAKSICRVCVRQEDGKILEYATGFMISPNLVITNNHVIPNPEKANSATIQFDYEINIYKELKEYTEFRLNPAAFFITHDKLDYTIVAVEKAPVRNSRPLNDFGWLKLYRETGKVVNYEYVTIIQHPQGEAKQIALRENKIIAILDNYLRYHTDTASGSSGACVFNDQWQVVALHHMGIPEMKGDKYVSVEGKLLSKNEIHDDKQLVWIANQGVRISKILENLSQRENENAFVKELMQKNVQLTTQEFEKMMDELNKNIQSKYGYRNKEYEAPDNIIPVKDGLTIQIPITIEFGTNGNISVNALSKEQPDKYVIAENKTPLPVSSGGEIFTEAMVVDPDYTI